MSAPKKQFTAEDVIASLGASGVSGSLAVAKHYVSALEPCVGAECIVKTLANLDPTRWQKELTESANRLTYLNSDVGSDGERLDHIKGFRDDATIGKNFILEYDAVLTTRTKDRVGDVLETKGLEMDPKHPLLWQHLQMQPIGALVKAVYQDETKYIGRYGIADTELGRDAAVLVKCGALRKSIGFKPSEMAPIEIVKGADGKDIVRGWHITKSFGLEGSLVSVPCNGDAIVLGVYEKNFGGIATAYSRGELKHEVMKHWAKSIYDVRPSSFAVGAEINSSGEVVNATTKAETPTPAGQGEAHACTCKKSAGEVPAKKGMDNPDLLDDTVVTSECETCVCKDCGAKYQFKAGGDGKSLASGEVVTKGLCAAHTCKTCGKQWSMAADKSAPAGDVVTKSVDVPGLITKLMGVEDELEGSFEWIRDRLNESAKMYLMASGKLSQLADCYASVGATFPGSALISVYMYGSGEKYLHFTANYEMKDGKPVWVGEPAAVEIKTQIINKRLDAEIESRSPVGIAKQLGAAVVGLPVGSPAGAAVRKSIAAINTLMDADERISDLDKVGF